MIEIPDSAVMEAQLALDLGVDRSELVQLRKRHSGEIREYEDWIRAKSVFWTVEGVEKVRRHFNLPSTEEILPEKPFRPQETTGIVVHTYRNRRLLHARLEDHTDIQVVVNNNEFYGRGDRILLRLGPDGKWNEAKRPRRGRGKRSSIPAPALF